MFILKKLTSDMFICDLSKHFPDRSIIPIACLEFYGLQYNIHFVHYDPHQSQKHDKAQCALGRTLSNSNVDPSAASALANLTFEGAASDPHLTLRVCGYNKMVAKSIIYILPINNIHREYHVACKCTNIMTAYFPTYFGGELKFVQSVAT